MDRSLDALKIWMMIKSKEGCERTVNLLKKDGKAENVKLYLKWVLEVQPAMGMTLFEE